MLKESPERGSFCARIKDMESVFAMVFLFIIGAMLGSFACCQVWRIRKGDKSKWSHCMNCKYQLRWYDNIPIISWLMLGGKCRKCRKKIGYAEILAEVGLALVFALSFWFWPERVALLELNVMTCVKFALFLANLVIYTILFIYDAKWKELPVPLLIGACGVAAVFLGITIWQAFSLQGGFDWLSLLLALLFLPGLYYLMYRVSSESWVGGGDWILCIPLALTLGNMWLALMCMFLANVIGSVVMLPVAVKKKKKNMVIPFGPFLILGFLVVFFLQTQILNLVIV